MNTPECLGVRVVYDPEMASASITLDPTRWWWPWRCVRTPGLCESRGIWRWKKIVVGPPFTRFPPREQQAILLHEVGHAKLKHVEQRLLAAWKIILAPLAFARLAVQQEHQADAFARGCGYGPDLARALARCSVGPVESLHPNTLDRIARLTGGA